MKSDEPSIFTAFEWEYVFPNRQAKAWQQQRRRPERELNGQSGLYMLGCKFRHFFAHMAGHFIDAIDIGRDVLQLGTWAD
ncbi:MAG: hypothetical protein EOO40_02155 [Deltaproteobacteria bacterium]|nr:MAG: hypothetical protein EOO40_02155 [Deltaproteobacteria bacterium]